MDVKLKGLLEHRAFAATGFLPSDAQLDSVMRSSNVKNIFRSYLIAHEGSDVSVRDAVSEL